jgi:hypothetical protein
MRIVLFSLVLAMTLFAHWAPMPVQTAAEETPTKSMPKVEDDRERGWPISVQLECPPSSWVASPCALAIRITNTGAKPAANLLLSAVFAQQLEHETKANPVELRIGGLMAGESKQIPLMLTPSQAGEFLVQVSLAGDNGIKSQAECKIKAEAATSYTPPQVDYQGTTSIRSFVFAQAQSQAGCVSVSFLSTAYVLRSYYPGGNEKAPQAHYYEPVTSEVKNEYPPDQIRAMTASGKRLDSQELTKALKQNTTVLLFYERETIDPFILGMFKPESLILVLPSTTQQAAPSEKTIPVPVKADGKSAGIRPYPSTNKTN